MKLASKLGPPLYTAALAVDGVLSIGCTMRNSEAAPSNTDIVARRDSAIFAALLLELQQETFG